MDFTGKTLAEAEAALYYIININYEHHSPNIHYACIYITYPHYHFVYPTVLQGVLEHMKTGPVVITINIRSHSRDGLYQAYAGYGSTTHVMVAEINYNP